ncbi:MAG: DNA repair protein RecO [Spirochaetes bacterium]|nr:DNA repair protein RecO [Spirochaetota bacterium]
MEILKTTGIALSSHVSGEADIICNYYTIDSGKRKFVFKGLRKSRKRSLSATEPGTVANIVYYHREDRGSFIVNDVSIEKYYSSFSADLKKIFHLYFILECVEKTTGYEARDESLFRLLIAAIEVLSKTNYPAHLTAFFTLRLLKGHGILPDLATCKICGKKISSQFTLDLIDLRPVCGICLADDRGGPVQGSALLSRDMIVYVNECNVKKFSMIDLGRYQEEDVLNLIFTYSLFMENYFHWELKSKSFILSARYR